MNFDKPEIGNETTLRTTLVVLVFVLVSVGAVAPVVNGASDASPSRLQDSSGVAATVTNQDCDPPVKKQKRAKALESLLENLHSRHPSVVDDDTLSNVRERISRGDTNFDLNRYCDAREGYESAIAIAVPELKRAYTEAANHQLDEVKSMLTVENSSANPDPDVGQLREQRDRLRGEINNAESLRDRRSLYQQATELKEDTEEKLPTTWWQQFRGIVNPALAGTAGLLFVVVVVENAYLWYKNRQEGGGTGGPMNKRRMK